MMTRLQGRVSSSPLKYNNVLYNTSEQPDQPRLGSMRSYCPPSGRALYISNCVDVREDTGAGNRTRAPARGGQGNACQKEGVGSFRLHK